VPASLRERALRLLARREHSREELRRKLAAAAGDDEDTEAIEALLDDLTARQLLSDARFAEQRTTLRGSRYGNARLQYELRTRGVDDAQIDQALAAAGDEAERAVTVWRKKFGKLPATREERAKQARFLQARGFSPDTIRRVLKHGADQDD
jgi:regulatory protein